MNENTDSLSDDEAFVQQIIQGARRIQPDALFAANLEQTLMQTVPQKKPKMSSRRIFRLMGTVAAVLILVVVATFNVPSLRAIAEEIIGLLIRAQADKTIGYFMDQSHVQLFASLEKAEADLAHDFVVPQYLPSTIRANKEISVKFQMLYCTAETSSVQISYSPSFDLDSMWFFSFQQTPSEVYQTNGRNSVGASAEIKTVSFNFRGKPVSAQFVKGGWWAKIDVEDRSGLEALPTATLDSIDLQWSTESGNMSLTWESDGIVYSFFTTESWLFDITIDELIRIAESIE